MALIGYTITVVAKQDNPYNVLPETDISIRKNSDNTLVNIYADEAGLIPIAQLGAKTDSNGQFTFYADASLGILKAVWTNGGVTSTEVLDSGDHARLVNRNAVGAHDASAINTDGGSTVQDELDALSGSSGSSSDFGSSLCTSNNAALVVVGDSITLGTGSSSLLNSYANLLSRSLFNSFGGNGDIGIMYETQLNLYREISLGRCSATGFTLTFSNYGPSDRAIIVPSDGVINFTGYECKMAGVIYDGDNSTATSIEVYRDDVLVTTISTASGINNSGVTTLDSGNYISKTQKVSFKAIGGTLTVIGYTPLRQSSIGTLAFFSAKDGTDTTYHLGKASTLISCVNTLTSSRVKVVLIALGTNDIFSTRVDKSPSDFINALDSLVSAYITGFGSSAKIVLQVPYSTTGTPALGEYSEYVDALIEYAEANSHQLIRLDKTGLNANASLLPDGIHPNDTGHRILAAKYCNDLNITFNPQEFQPTAGKVVFNDTWARFSATGQVGAIKRGHVVSLKGLVASNASASTTVCTIESGFRPNVDRYVVMRTSAGTTTAKVTVSGTVVIDGAIPSWVSLDGISYSMSQ